MKLEEQEHSNSTEMLTEMIKIHCKNIQLNCMFDYCYALF